MRKILGKIVGNWFIMYVLSYYSIYCFFLILAMSVFSWWRDQWKEPDLNFDSDSLSGCPFTSISLWLIEWITLGLSCDGRLYTMYNKTIHICMGQYAYGFIFISIVQKLSCWWMVWWSLSNNQDLIICKQDWYILF